MEVIEKALQDYEYSRLAQDSLTYHHQSKQEMLC